MSVPGDSSFAQRNTCCPREDATSSCRTLHSPEMPNCQVVVAVAPPTAPFRGPFLGRRRLAVMGEPTPNIDVIPIFTEVASRAGRWRRIWSARASHPTGRKTMVGWACRVWAARAAVAISQRYVDCSATASMRGTMLFGPVRRLVDQPVMTAPETATDCPARSVVALARRQGRVLGSWARNRPGGRPRNSARPGGAIRPTGHNPRHAAALTARSRTIAVGIKVVGDLITSKPRGPATQSLVSACCRRPRDGARHWELVRRGWWVARQGPLQPEHGLLQRRQLAPLRLVWRACRELRFSRLSGHLISVMAISVRSGRRSRDDDESPTRRQKWN